MRRYQKYLILAASSVLISTFLLIHLRAQFTGPAVNRWTTTADLTLPREGACAATLNDGRVLVAGGQGVSGPVNTVEFYSPNGAVAAGPPMLTPRAGQACVTLQDNRVLVTGGMSGAGGRSVSSGEVFDPANSTWQPVTSMSFARTGHTATLTPWGAVVISGGTAGGVATGAVEIYTNKLDVVQAGQLPTARSGHAVAATRRFVVIAGGADSTGTIGDIEVFDSASGAMQPAGSLLTPRRSFAATALLDGTVMFLGGYDQNGSVLSSTEIFDPLSGTIVAGPSLLTPRAGHQAYTLPNNGAVIVVGGTDGNSLLNSTEMNPFYAGKFSAGSPIGTPRTGLASAFQPGALVIAGGRNSGGYLAGTELFGFATAGSGKADYHPGEIASFSGRGWQPGENVLIKITTLPVDKDNIEYTVAVQADRNGYIAIGGPNGFNIDKSHLGRSFVLTATGSQSIAQSTFTDASTETDLITVNPSGSSQVYGTAMTFEGNVCTPSCGGNPVTLSTNPVDHNTVYILIDGAPSGVSGNAFDTLNPTTSGACGAAPCYSNFGPFGTPPNIPVGAHQITATYTGDVTYSSSTSTNYPLTITGFNTSMTVSLVDAATQNFGQAQAFQAVVTSGAGTPTGQVTFTDTFNNASLGTYPLDGTGTATTANISSLAVGSHTIQASYVATGGFTNAGPNSAPAYTVNQLDPAIPQEFTITANPPTSTAFSPVTFTVGAAAVAGASPAGLLTLQIDGNPYGSPTNIVGGTAIFNVPAGVLNFTGSPHSIQVNYTEPLPLGTTPWFGESGLAGILYTTSKAPTAATTVSAAPPSPSPYSTPITFTATVAETGTSSGGQITGSVQFQLDPPLGPTVSGAVSLAGGIYQAQGAFTSAQMSVGAHSVVATYQGDGQNLASAGSVPLPYTITNDTTSVVLSPGSNNVYLGQNNTYTITVTGSPATAGNPTGTITLSDSLGAIPIAENNCTVANFAANVGSCTITVAYTGAAGTATGTGTHLLTATYAPTALNNYAGGTSNTSTVTVNPTATSITAPSATGLPLTYGNSTTLSAQVCPTAGCPFSPATTGAVKFFDNGVLLGAADSFNQTSGAVQRAADGTAGHPLLGGGSHTITVTFNDNNSDLNFAASSSPTLIFTVARATPVQGTLTPNGATGVTTTYGATLGTLVTATIQTVAGGVAPTGTFTVAAGGIQLGGTFNVVGAGMAVPANTQLPTTLGVNNSPYTLVFSYSGDANYAPNPPPPFSAAGYLKLNKATASCPVVTSGSPSAEGTPVTFTATCTSPTTGTPTGTVTFTDAGPSPVSFGPQIVNLNASGVAAYTTGALAPFNPHVVTATYSGDSNFNAPGSPATVNQRVNPGATSVTLSPSNTSPAVGQTVTYTVVVGVPSQSISPVGAVPAVSVVDSTAPGTPLCTILQGSLTASAGAPYTLTGSCNVQFNGPVGATNGPGNHTEYAIFTSNDGNQWANGQSANVTVAVGLTPTSTAAPGSTAGNNYNYAATTQLSTTVTPASGSFTTLPTTGTVTFYDGATVIGGGVTFNTSTGAATLSGVLLTPGAHPITAKFSGDANYGPSTSAAYNITVNKATISAGSFTLVPAAGVGITASYGSAVSGTVTIAGTAGGATPTGTVTVQVCSTAACNSGVVANLGTFPLNGAGTAAWSATLPASVVVSGSPYYGSFTYSGDSNYTSGADPSGYFTITLTNSACSLVSLTNPSVAGTPVTFRVTCATTVAGGSGVPSGTVTLTDSVGSFTPQALTLNALGVATYNTAALSAGVHNITAVYAGDGNFNGTTATPNPLVQTVNTGSTQVVLVPSTVSIPVNGSITYSVNVTVPANSVSPIVGTVQVYDTLQVAAICTQTVFTGGPTTYTATCPATPYTGAAGTVFGAGVHTLSATFTSNNLANWSSGSSISKNITVGGTTTTTALPGSSQGTAYSYAQTTNLTTTVTPASGSFASLPTTGTVNWYDGTTLLAGGSFSGGNGQASLTGVLLTPGSHSITAQFTGDVNYAASTSNILTIVVSKYTPGFTIAPASITVAYGSSLPAAGDSVTMATATGSPAAALPTGTVAITAGSTPLGTFTLVGGATGFNSVALPGSLSATPGIYGVGFAYSGDTNYNSNSQINAAYLTITKITAICTLVSNSNPSSQNNPVTFTATCVAPASSPNALPPSGTITFSDSASNFAATAVNMVNGVATFTTAALQPGTGGSAHTITASYSGDTNYNAPAAPTVIQSVNPGNTTVTVSASTTTPAMGTTVTYTVIVAVPTGVQTPQGSVVVNDVTGGLPGLNMCTILAANLTAVAGQPNEASGSCPLLYNNSNAQTAPGIHNVDAAYTSGNNNIWTSATSAPITVTAGLKPTTISAVTDNPSTTAINYGTGLTFSAVVSPHAAGLSPAYTGVVSFVDTTGGSCNNAVPPVCVGGTSTVIGTAVPDSTTGIATIPAVGTILLAGGTHIITAQFVGDANYSQSPVSASLVIVVTGVTPTVNIVGGPFNVPIGGTLTINTITVTGIPGDGVPTGTVTIYSSNTLIGTAAFVSNNAATAQATYSFTGPIPTTLLPAGNTNDLHAVFTSSNNSYTNANSSNVGLIVTKQTTTTAVVSSADPSVTGQTVTFTATVTPTGYGAAPTGNVTFSINGTNVSTVNVSPTGNLATATLTVPTASIPLPDGANPIVAVYNGDGNYLGSSSPNTSSTWLVQQVNKAATTTYLASSVDASVVGQGVQLTAYITVNSPGNSTATQQPSGQVTFFNTIAGVPQNMGTIALVPAPAGGPPNTWMAVCNTGSVNCTALPQGNLNLTAVYSGDANFLTSTSQQLTQAVNKPTVVVVTQPNNNPVIYGTAVTFTSTVAPNPPGAGTPTGNLIFTDGGVQIATIALVGGQATYTVTLGSGMHSIGVQYSGDANYQGYIEPAIALLVNKIPSAISVTSSAPTAVASQVITITGSISPSAPAGAAQPTGQIQFTADGLTIGVNVVNPGTQVATITVANLPPGFHQIQAIYSGDANWAPATSAFIPETVTAAQTVTQVTSSANPAVYGQQVTFTVAVAVTLTGTVPASGNVQLFDNAVGVGTPVSISSGTATITIPSLSVGVHNITATFIGNASFNASTSAALVETVNKAPTVTSLVAVPGNSTSNQSVSLTAVVAVPAPSSGTPVGTVTFTDTTSGTVLGTAPLTVIGGVVTASTTTTQLNQSGSARLLTATYSGDANFAASTSSPTAETVFGAQVAVANWASYQTTNFGNGSIVSIFGQNLAGTALAASSVSPLPNSLGGTSVTVTDSAGVQQQCGLYYVSGTLVDAVIPQSAHFGLATLTVTNGSGSTASTVILITFTGPGVYTANGNGLGVAAANVVDVTPAGVQTYSNTFQVSSTNPGQFVAAPIATNKTDTYFLILYGTGWRNATAGQVTATVNGVAASVKYAGPQGIDPGLDQVNIQLPSGLTGTVNVVLSVAGQAANTVTVTFQ